MSTTPPQGGPYGPYQNAGQASSQGSSQGSANQAWQNQGSPTGGVGQRLEEAMELIEMELRHAIAYVNDAVIPQVRRESITAMRSLSETLRNLADRVERSQTPPRGPQS
jgi:hypothetical protein